LKAKELAYLKCPFILEGPEEKWALGKLSAKIWPINFDEKRESRWI